MKKLLVAGLAILGSLGVVGAAGAITYESGTPVPVAEIMDFSPSGASMVGMAVTAYFSGTRASETYYWAGSGTTGGVVGNDWSLSESGNTYSNPWTLTSTGASIQKIVLDGLPGKTVFDVSDRNDFFTEPTYINSDKIGTAGSALGKTFVVSGGSYTGDVTATYSSLVYLTLFNTNTQSWDNYDPVGDLYRYLTIDFGANYFVGSTGTAKILTFQADTDTVVPEPATLLLFATGLAGLAAVGRRRRT